jgi:hypothetical protein
MSRGSLSELREIARRFVDEHGSVMVCPDCGHVCGSAIGETSDFHNWDWELFVALLDQPCPVIYERERREIEAGECAPPRSLDDLQDRHEILTALAREGREEDFKWFARSTGTRAEAVHMLWLKARCAIENPE